MAVPRKFDYDEARRLRAQGMTYAEIGALLGVSGSAIHLACNDAARERNNANSARWTRENARRACSGGCGRLVWTHMKGRTGYCPTCFAREIRAADSVRPTLLFCHYCEEWKPDEDFPRRRSLIARRGRAAGCRVCQTELKRDWRERNKVPCSHGCGRMVEGKSRRNNDKPFECHPCAMKRIHGVAA